MYDFFLFYFFFQTTHFNISQLLVLIGLICKSVLLMMSRLFVFSYLKPVSKSFQFVFKFNASEACLRPFRRQSFLYNSKIVHLFVCGVVCHLDYNWNVIWNVLSLFFQHILSNYSFKYQNFHRSPSFRP